MKIVLLLVDGMRPDAIADFEIVQHFEKDSAYTYHAETVFPSVTLPCHMSLFHSTDPDRHGILSNVYVPQARPVPGLCEILTQQQKKCAFFYNWEALRDLSLPGSLAFSYFSSGRAIGYEAANREVADAAIRYLSGHAADFTFLYLGWSDSAGHDAGWMSEEYMRALRESWALIENVRKSLTREDLLIVTSDHGGHGRCHGSDCKEDMQIPLFLCGGPFGKGSILADGINIKDIAPTILEISGICIPEEWEGKSFL